MDAGWRRRGVGCPACEFDRCPFRPPAPLSQSKPCPELPCLQRLPRQLPGRSRPPQPGHPADRDGIEPSRAATCAATTRRFDNCQARGPAASPGRWRRSSGWSQTTSPETRRRGASAYPEIRCPPSPTSDSCTSNTGTRWHAPATPYHFRNVDTETPPPPQPKQILATAFFGRKPGLEFLKRPRVIFHPATILPVGAT